jgi:hypothetical protein
MEVASSSLSETICRQCGKSFCDCIPTKLFPNGHLEETKVDWQRKYETLYAAVLKHYSQKADDRCHFDDDELYAAAGLPTVDRRVGDKFEMTKNCLRFLEKRCEEGGWSTYVELEDKLKEVEKERDELKAYITKAKISVKDLDERIHQSDIARKWYDDYFKRDS